MTGIFEFTVLILLVLMNGFFALSEMAVVLAKRMRLQQQAEKSQPGAADALYLAEESGSFISTVQLGITLVGVAAGAFGGSAFADQIAPLLERIPGFEPYAEAVSVALVVLMITYLSIVLGELVPKKLAISNPEGFAQMTAPVMRVLSRLGRPLVRFLNWSTQGVIKILGIKIAEQEIVTDEDLRMLIDQGAVSGVLTRDEEVMLEQVLNFDESRIESLVTPRSQIVWLDIDASQEEIRKMLIEHNWSKYPVAKDDLDQLSGVVYAQDLLKQYLTTGSFDLQAVLQPPVIVPESLNVLKTINRLQQTQSGIAFVINEFGGVDGLIADEDLTEALIGFKPGAQADTDPAIVRRADGSYLLDGLLPLTTFRDLMGKNPIVEGDERLYQTLGGLVMAELGKIPMTGDSLTWEEIYLEVIDMDGNRVDKVLVKKEGFLV